MIEAIENSAYAVWVRESPSIFAYTTILSLHAIGLAIIVGIHTLVALRLLGFVQAIPLAADAQAVPVDVPRVRDQPVLRLIVARGELDATTSGNWLFIAKLVFIALAMINLELTRMWVFDRPVIAAPGELPKRSRTVAIAALVLWSLAMVAGRFTAYPNFVEAWLGF